MRIEIVDADKRRTIRIPTGLLLNPLTAAAARRVINKSLDAHLSPGQCSALFQALRATAGVLRRQDVPLVEALSADGENVRITF